MRPIIVAILALALAVAWAPSSSRAQYYWSFGEFQPNVPSGGRADTIAVKPGDPNRIIVASDTGGLFVTDDSGFHWSHIDNLAEYSTVAVAWVPAIPNSVLATVSEDFRTANGGGIWRSVDGGATWTQVFSPPTPAGVPYRFGGREISIAPDTGAIFVATTFGVARSLDNGMSWTSSDPFGGADPQTLAIAALGGNRVVAAGPYGVRYSSDNGAHWFAPATPLSGAGDVHALGASPASTSHAYYVDGAVRLWASEDGGDHWTQATSAPGGGGCGGIAFVHVRSAPGPSGGGGAIKLYFGNRCGVARLTPTPHPGNHFTYPGPWTTLNADHGDVRDIAFKADNTPWLLASDGGLHKSPDGGLNWSFTGGGVGGYNALQVTEIKSQHIGASGAHDLYYATQDNSVLASQDDGDSWPYSRCCEGFFFEMQPAVADAASAQVSFVTCFGCGNKISGRLFSGAADWSNAPGPAVGNPKIVRRNFHVQAVGDSASLAKGMAKTNDLGVSWRQYGVFPEATRDIPKLSTTLATSRQPARPVLYQAVRTGWDAARNFEIVQLMRIGQTRFGTPSVSYPAMRGFGGLGINPTMFAWYQVFAVNPGDSRHLFAPDVVNQQIMESRNGGDDWSPRADMTALATQGGAFRFNTWVFPHASAFAFNARNPNMVAFGTHHAGVFVSADRGATWTALPGSDGATVVTSLQWIEDNDLIVSSYGRGLWRAKRILAILRQPPLCRAPCDIFRWPPDLGDPAIEDPLWNRDANRLTRAVVVLGGRMQGARLANGRLAELFVSPGASVGWRGLDQSAPPKGFKITASRTWRGFEGGGKTAFKPNAKAIVVGLAIGSRGQPLGAILSPAPLSAKRLVADQAAGGTALPPDDPDGPVGSPRSPTQGKPYLSLAGVGADNRVTAGAALSLTLSGLQPGAQVVVLIDGRPAGKGEAGAKGELDLRIQAPTEARIHTIVVRDARSAKVIDGAMILVVHEDPKERESKQPR